jgi:hypothetical protein
MLSERAKIDNAKKQLRRQYLGSPLTNGEIEVGKFYVIANFVNGDDFSNVGTFPSSCGSTKGRTDSIFKATGTTPGVWTKGSELREWKLDEIKALAELAFNSAKKTVTVTNTGFEGGSGSGEITFDRSILWFACEELIEETDPGYVMPNRPTREIGFTVQVG